VSEPRKAATVLVLRDGAAGLEVFMVQRNRRVGFLPNAWVFPGGRVDAADATAAVAGAVSIPGLDDEAARAFGVAAARETFEEAGIRLAAPDGAWDLDRLAAWARWITPAAEPKRFDTVFLLARAGEDPAGWDHAVHDGGETVDSRWVRPAEAVRDTLAAFPLAPPTWWCLRQLAGSETVAAAFADRTRDLRPVQPVMRFGEEGMLLLLPGHAEHPDPARDDVPDEIGWDRERWVARRSGTVL
jgi:8-oxo-dGTP pyrophosphatase MutT (NUDIX family)